MKRNFSMSTLWYWILTVLPLVITAAVYPAFPEIIPAHYNLEGVVDRYGSKAELFILPGLVLVMAPLVWLLMNLAKKSLGTQKLQKEELQSRNLKAIAVIRLVFLGVFNMMTIILLITAWKDSKADTGKMTLDIYRLVAVLLSIMDILLGNILPKCRQNSVMGIRTPWTMESEEIWYQTHRFGGFCMVGGGIISLICCLFLSGLWAMGVYLTITILVSLVLVGYSWWISKHGGKSGR